MVSPPQNQRKSCSPRFVSLFEELNFFISGTSIWWDDGWRLISSGNSLRKSQRICEPFIIQVQKEGTVLTSERNQRKNKGRAIRVLNSLLLIILHQGLLCSSVRLVLLGLQGRDFSSLCSFKYPKFLQLNVLHSAE